MDNYLSQRKQEPSNVLCCGMSEEKAKTINGKPFSSLFAEFVSGSPIKRKHWKGYWCYKLGKIEIHTRDGEIINFANAQDVLFTISHITQNDWVIADNDNCKVLKNENLHNG